MRPLVLCALCAALAVGAVNQALAGSVSIQQVPNTIPNTYTHDIKINASPGVLIGAMQILVQLTSGSIVEHQFQSPNGQPPNSAFLGAFPDLAYDSFVAAGVPTNDQAPLVLGPSLELGGPAGPAAVFVAQTYDASWGPPLGQDNAGRQGYLAARLTLSNTANGTFKFKVDFSDNTSAGSGFGNFGTLQIVNGGAQIEPSFGNGTVSVRAIAATPPIDQNYVAQQILLGTAAGSTITDMQVYSQLTTGSFLVRPSGGPTPQWLPPNPPGGGPAEEFSSYLAAGGATPTVAGISVDLGSPNSGGSIVFNNTTLDARWDPAAGQGTSNLVDWLAAQITPSKDASGFFRFRAVFTGTLGSTVRVIDLPIAGGVIGVPEPNTISLIGLAVVGVVGVVRRRK